MSKLYVKNGASLVPVSEDKVRNYESLDCVCAAIAAGCLKPGDLYTTICKTEAICDDLAATIYQILSYIPDTTNATTNKLLNHCDLPENMKVQVGSCCNEAVDNIVDITQSVIDAVYPIGSIYMNATSASTKPACGTWTAITGKMLLGTDASYALGTCGGSATVTLDTCQLPEHSHGFEVSSATINSSGSNSFSFSGCTCCCCFTPSACIRGYIYACCDGEHSHAIRGLNKTSTPSVPIENAFAPSSGQACYLVTHNEAPYNGEYFLTNGSSGMSLSCYSCCMFKGSDNYISTNACHRHEIDFSNTSCNSTSVCFDQICLGHITVGVDGSKTVEVSGTYAGFTGDTACTGNGCSICVLNPYQAVAMWYRNA